MYCTKWFSNEWPIEQTFGGAIKRSIQTQFNDRSPSIIDCSRPSNKKNEQIIRRPSIHPYGRRLNNMVVITEHDASICYFNVNEVKTRVLKEREGERDNHKCCLSSAPDWSLFPQLIGDHQNNTHSINTFAHTLTHPNAWTYGPFV